MNARQGMSRATEAGRSLSLRSVLRLAVAVPALMLPQVALAQDPPSAVQAQPCPPGSWFCNEAPAAQAPAQAPAAAPAPQAPAQAPAPAAAPPAPPTLQQLPPPDAKPAEAPKATPVAEPPKSEAPVVIYQPPPVMVVPAGDAPATYDPKPRPAAQRDKPEWGLNLNVQGSIMGSGAAKGAGMGGVGVGLRYRPIPYFALQGAVTFMGGRDYNATQRGETSFVGSFMIFLNPRDSFQLFLTGGFGWSSARIGDDKNGNPGPGYNYNYFGGIAGGGAEWRLAKHFALYGDVRAFLRTRTDAYAAYEPEFRDAYGRTTNTSAGGLFSGGMTFYF
jgi:hypothetical protein